VQLQSVLSRAFNKAALQLSAALGGYSLDQLLPPSMADFALDRRPDRVGYTAARVKGFRIVTNKKHSGSRWPPGVVADRCRHARPYYLLGHFTPIKTIPE
jgi:hypothetical protein